MSIDMQSGQWPHDIQTSPARDDQGAATEIARLNDKIEAQDWVIRQQQAALAHSQAIFERAASAAKLGVWECDLPSETLRWTDQVYDMFDLPRGSPLDRGRTLDCYAPASLSLLESLRSEAIAARSGFAMDAEIVTPNGNHRWIRLTATVECVDGIAVRIFGMKQDITEEKILAERTRYLAEFDLLTGLSNRSAFQTALSGLGQPGAEATKFSALVLVDLDGFKQINDTLGHAIGDECLRQAAARLKVVCQGAAQVARIGGDEFAAILGANLDREAATGMAAAIVAALREPCSGDGWSSKGGASVGVAYSGTSDPDELFVQADTALYAAKAGGRNTFRVFDPTAPSEKSVRSIPIRRSAWPGFSSRVEARVPRQTPSTDALS